MASSSSSSSKGYASIESDSSSGSSTPVASPFLCSCGRALDSKDGPIILNTCGHNFCGICAGEMILDGAQRQRVHWLSATAIICTRCDLYSATATLRRNDLAAEVMRAAEVNRDVSHTLMQHAAAKIERLQEQVDRTEAAQKTVDEKLAESVAMLQAAKKCIIEERSKNSLLVAKVTELMANVNAIGFQLKVEERVRKQLDVKLATFERMFPRFDPSTAPPPGFEHMPRGSFAPTPPPVPRCPPPQPPIGSGRPSRSAVPPPAVTPAQPPRITMDAECEALEMILSQLPSEYALP